MRLLCTIHETVFKRLDKKLLQYFKSAVNFLYAKIINLKFFCLIYKKNHYIFARVFPPMYRVAQKRAERKKPVNRNFETFSVNSHFGHSVFWPSKLMLRQNSVDFYFGDKIFISQKVYRLSSLRAFVVFLSLSMLIVNRNFKKS